MLRKLFALLLLLTGLAALGHPAQARAFDGERSPSAAAADYAAVSPAQAMASGPGGGVAHDPVQPGLARSGQAIALPFVAVRVQADRARE